MPYRYIILIEQNYKCFQADAMEKYTGIIMMLTFDANALTTKQKQVKQYSFFKLVKPAMR